MQSLQKLQTELRLNTEMVELINTLKGVAVVEFQRLEKRKERFERFFSSIDGFFRFIDFSKVKHPFVNEKGRTGIVMVTSDEGFMGGLNTKVIHEALNYCASEDSDFIILGKRGANYLRGMGYDFEEFPGIGVDDRYAPANKLKEHLIKRSLSERLSRIVLFYPKPISFFVQKIERVHILPCQNLFKGYEQEKGLEDISKVVESRIQQWISRIPGMDEDIIVESSLEDMIEYLVEVWLTQKLFEVFEDSKLAELSARAVHLEESQQHLGEQAKELKHQYFRSHHELIDKDLRDMFSAQAVRRKKRKTEKAGTHPLFSKP